MDKNKSGFRPLVQDPKVSQNTENMSSVFTRKLFFILVVAVVLGVVTGYLLNLKNGTAGGNTLTSGTIKSSEITKGTIVGSNDTKTFKDTTTGTLKNGEIDIDVNSIQITSSRKLYGNTNGT